MAKEKPYRRHDVLHALYVECEWSSVKIGEAFDVSPATICRWLERNGIERRGNARGQKSLSHATYLWRKGSNTHGDIEVWRDQTGYEMQEVKVHRLLAVAKYGFDAVTRDMAVHHGADDRYPTHPETGIGGTEVPWLNYLENIELQTKAEHAKTHHATEHGRERMREHAESKPRDAHGNFV